MDLFSGLNPAHLTRLQAILQRLDYAEGSVIFREGEPATQVYLLARGIVGIHVAIAEDRSKRLATLSPGICFGEMALLDGKPRSAEVRAETPVVVHALDIARLHDLAVDAPEILSTIILNLGRELSRRLRAANNEIRTWE